MQTENITLAQLTAEQLVALKKQLNAVRKEKSKGRGACNTLIDSMMREKDGIGFIHTTTAVLAALQAKLLIPNNLSKEERNEELKKIQTRKQKLLKLKDKEGKLVHAAGTLGFKQSTHVVGPLTVERVMTWLETASPAELAKIRSAVKSK